MTINYLNFNLLSVIDYGTLLQITLYLILRMIQWIFNTSFKCESMSRNSKLVIFFFNVLLFNLKAIYLVNTLI